MRGLPPIRTICRASCALAVLVGISSPVPAGTITFSGGLAGPPPLLGTIATPASIASGASITQTFSASAAGVGSVSGSLLLNNAGGSPSISILNLTVVNARPSLGFNFTATQDFAFAGAPTLDAALAASGTANFTGPNQIASMGISGSVRGAPDNPFTTLSPGSGASNFSVVSDTFPVAKPLTPDLAASAVGVPASGPVTMIFAFSSTLIGAGTSITLAPGSGVSATAIVPEPGSLALLGLGLAALGGLRLRRRAVVA